MLAYLPADDAYAQFLTCGHRSREPPSFRRLDGLAVDDGGGRLAIAAQFLAQVTTQLIVGLFPDSGFSPVPEVVIDKGPGWQIMGHIAPGTSGARDKKDGVDDFASRIGRVSTAFFHGRDPRF